MNTLSIAFVLGLLCLWPVVAGVGEAKKLNPYTGQVDAIQEGKTLYDRYGCADCHRSERGAGGSGRGLPRSRPGSCRLTCLCRDLPAPGSSPSPCWSVRSSISWLSGSIGSGSTSAADEHGMGSSIS